MARQALLTSQPYPILVSETGNRQSVLAGSGVTEAASVASYSLSLDAITYAQTLQTLALNKGFRLVVANVGFTYTLNALALRNARKLVVGAVSYTVELASVNPVLALAAASYVTAPQDLTLTYTPVTTKLVLEAITFDLELEEILLQWSRPFAVATTSYTTTLQALNLLRPYRITIDGISVSLSLGALSLEAPRLIAYPLTSRTITI